MRFVGPLGNRSSVGGGVMLVPHVLRGVAGGSDQFTHWRYGHCGTQVEFCRARAGVGTMRFVGPLKPP